MTIREFETFLGDIEDNLSNLDKVLIPEVNDIVQGLKDDAPVNNGKLRDSIQGIITGDNVEIVMKAYGVYQNYGVNGNVKSKEEAQPIEDGVEGAGYTMQFGTARMIHGKSGLSYGARTNIIKFGLKPKNWFSMQEITEQLVEAIQNNTQP